MVNIRQRESVPGGFMVTVEVPAAYTDGASRFERIFVADAAVRGKAPDQARQAIKDALDDPLAALIGEDVAAPAPTKAILEDQMDSLFETWRRWQLTRIEAQARGVAAGVITALTARENGAWTAYVAAIQVWRSAP